MGAEQFFTVACGPNVAGAFYDVREQAFWDHGHGGGTGTIAEKNTWVVVTDDLFETEEAAQAYAEAFLRSGPDSNPDESTPHSKWGPAGAVQFLVPDHHEEGQFWLFFGYANS